MLHVLFMLCNYNIYFYYIGLYQLPVTNLVQPQNDLRLIRKLDTTFLKNLKKGLKMIHQALVYLQLQFCALMFNRKKIFLNGLRNCTNMKSLEDNTPLLLKQNFIMMILIILCTIKYLLKFM